MSGERGEQTGRHGGGGQYLRVGIGREGVLLTGGIAQDQFAVIAAHDQAYVVAGFAQLKLRMNDLGRVQDVIEQLRARGAGADAGEVRPKRAPLPLHLMAGGAERGVAKEHLFAAGNLPGEREDGCWIGRGA